MVEQSLKGKMFVVTGGLSGTGAVMTEALVSRDARVIAIRRTDRPNHTGKLLKRLGTKAAERVYPLVLDVSSEDAVLIINEKVKQTGNSNIDGILHFAAVGLSKELTGNYVEKVNHLAVKSLTLGLINIMNRGSRVLGYPSMWSFLCGREDIKIPDYYNLVARTKKAGEEELLKLAQSAAFLEREIRVGLVCSNGIEGTAAWRSIIQKDQNAQKEALMLGRQVKPKEVVEESLDMIFNDFPTGEIRFVGINKDILKD